MKNYKQLSLVMIVGLHPDFVLIYCQCQYAQYQNNQGCILNLVYIASALSCVNSRSIILKPIIAGLKFEQLLLVTDRTICVYECHHRGKSQVYPLLSFRLMTCDKLAFCLRGFVELSLCFADAPQSSANLRRQFEPVMCDIELLFKRGHRNELSFSATSNRLEFSRSIS